ncbi:uncharacterized protein LOC120135412 [Hibiscus syriacus]|uniref:uncharacterized protein LOC120135412 n=1 Tax=Hibiscus syriacus TaxID=106335 RepID=UPI001923B730|nr:uncharacterized protein LOC120135412 [Hibiscus syriacus]
MNQTAFIRGRNIIDNSLLAQEMVKGYGRKVISPRCSMKIDLHKAFDSLHWGFILSILRALQFPNIFIDWIVICFTQARYSISFNGSLTGYFKGARGLRQGDPISPYLFVLAMNVLSNMLNLAAAKGIFAFHPKCKKIGLTHISFADDLLIFCKGNVDSVIGVLSVLDHFYQISGLNLNSSKSELFAAGISSRTLDLKLFTGFQDWVVACQIPRHSSRYKEINCQRLRAFTRQLILLLPFLNLWINSVPGFSGKELILQHKSYVLKEHDFWTFAAGSNVSWSFCRNLKLRSIAFPIVSAAHHRSGICFMDGLIDRLPTRDRLQKLVYVLILHVLTAVKIKNREITSSLTVLLLSDFGKHFTTERYDYYSSYLGTISWG